MHRGRVQIRRDRRLARIGDVERAHSEVRATRLAQRRRSGAVVAAHTRIRAVLAVVVMSVVLVVPAVAAVVVVIIIVTVVTAHLLLELRGLPVGAVAARLPHELEVAVEALEACGAQRRRHLALEGRLGSVVRSALGLGNGERNRLVAIAVAPAVGANDSGAGKGDGSGFQKRSGFHFSAFLRAFWGAGAKMRRSTEFPIAW